MAYSKKRAKVAVATGIAVAVVLGVKALVREAGEHVKVKKASKKGK
jgi:hypothetical protein